MKKLLLLLWVAVLSLASAGQTIQLTNGGSTTTPGTTSANPISAYFEYMRFQVVYTAAELNAAGITGPKAITQLGWYVSTAPGSPLPNYKIRMANTTLTNSATDNTSPLTEVYNVASYAPVAGGFNMLTLNGSFTWNGTDNLLVDVCYGAAPYVSPYGEVRTYAASTTNGSRRVRCDACGSQCGSATNTVNAFKPQVSLTFAAPPSCIPVTGFTVTPGGTTAALSWNTVVGATGYEWAVTSSATPPASGASAGTNSAGAAGLTGNTAYYAHVRTACTGGTFSTWTTTAFTTLCDGTVIPYTQNFDGVTAPAIPSCVIVQNVNGNNTWATYSTPTVIVIGAPNSMVYPYNSTSAANDWFYLQGLNLTAGTSYRLTFKWMSNPSYPEKFEIKYGTSPLATSMTSGTLYTNTNAASSTAVTENIDFTPSSTGTFFIGFHCYSDADKDFLAIDDVSVNLSPSCPNPSGLAITGTGSNTANFSWNAAGGATGYEWALTTVNTAPASGTAIAASPASLTGLAAGTQYYAHVRTACAGSTFSSWTTIPLAWLPNDSACGAVPLVLSGSNLCANTTSATSVGDPAMPGSCSTPNNTLWYSYTPSASGSVIVRTEIPSASTVPLDGWVAWYTATGSCGGPGLTLTPVAGSVCQSFGGTAGQVDELLSPNLTAGTKYYIIIDGVAGAFGEFCISVQAPPSPPSCTANISPANGATGVAIAPNTPISWNASATATSYDVYFGTVNPPTTMIGNTTATTVNVTGLAYSTTYYWYVTPKNTGGDATGCSANTTSFTTANPPANCVPLTTTGCTDADRIDLFRIKGNGGTELNINTTTCQSSAYTDSTDHPVVIDLTRSESYFAQAKAGTTGDYLTLWLDGNDNGLFETSERIMNNLLLSTSGTNFTVFVPASTPLGNHRLRARLVYYGTTTPPTAVTDPCAQYTYSDTKDFLVNITNVGTTRNVASFAGGSCYNGAADVIIDAASNNNNAVRVLLVDSLNNYIAGISPNGNNLGRVHPSYYKNNGALRQSGAPYNQYYLDRNITITVQTQPTAPYNLRLYFLNTELNAMIAQPGSGVTSIFDLNVTKNNDNCASAVTGLGAVVYNPTGFGSLSGDRFLDFTNVSGFSSFYFHGGASLVLAATLLDFTAERNGKVNLLKWRTAQELNMNHFVVERSADGRTFAPIGKVTASGNSSTEKSYSFTDPAPATGTNYYRLSIVDNDGKNKYSEIRSVRNDGSADVLIYPNPAKNIITVNVNADNASSAMMMITDLSGKVIFNRMVNILQGQNNIPVDVTRFASGSYLLKMQLGKEVIVKKFNKL